MNHEPGEVRVSGNHLPHVLGKDAQLSWLGKLKIMFAFGMWSQLFAQASGTDETILVQDFLKPQKCVLRNIHQCVQLAARTFRPLDSCEQRQEGLSKILYNLKEQNTKPN